MNNKLLTNTPKSPMLKATRLFELQALMKQIKPEIDQLKEELLVAMQKNDTYTLKTGSYTLSRAEKTTPQIESVDAIKKALDERKIPYYMEEVFGKGMNDVFKTLIDNGENIDGLSALKTEYISIRLTKKEPKNE